MIGPALQLWMNENDFYSIWITSVKPSQRVETYDCARYVNNDVPENGPKRHK
jgi:hypothetical protein